jgi:hypothetical protein
VVAETEVVTDGTEDRQQGLNVLGGLEALQHSLSLANGKMRVMLSMLAMGLIRLLGKPAKYVLSSSLRRCEVLVSVGRHADLSALPTDRRHA